ncbi:MAG: sulfatase-like hydrolase/transferase [Myxococcales bacterium]|nr:sulfatase-like hydrolase/transferase [Myxococcales bacterium]
MSTPLRTGEPDVSGDPAPEAAIADAAPADGDANGEAGALAREPRSASPPAIAGPQDDDRADRRVPDRTGPDPVSVPASAAPEDDDRADRRVPDRTGPDPVSVPASAAPEDDDRADRRVPDRPGPVSDSRPASLVAGESAPVVAGESSAPVATSRLGRAVRWLGASAAAACTGAFAAGAYEAIGLDESLGMAAATGFFAMLALPVLFVLSAVGRGLYAAWAPASLAERLAEERGSMPRLAGWVLSIMVCALVLAWIAFQGTWQLWAWTAFKPLTVGFVQPIIAVGGALALVVVSRPLARGFTALARRIDRRWLRRSETRRPLMRPLPIFLTAGLLSAGIAYGLWRIVVRPRIGPLDTPVLYGPAIALAVMVVVSAAWHRLPRRARIAGGVASAGLVAASIALALVAVTSRPSLTLEIWGDRPLAGVAIERLFDLDDIRADISLAEFQPVDRPGSPHPDIVLITIDTVRADHTPPYGGVADMPVLKALGERGVVFTWAFSPSNVTRRSIPSMVIGAAATRIKGRVIGWALRVDPRHVLVAERLRAGGYETAGFMCCRGFYDPEVRTGLQRGLEHLEIQANGRALGKAAKDWLAAREKQVNRRPLFLWMHILEPHNWEMGVSPPQAEAEKHALYDRSLSIADSIVGEVLMPLADRKPEQAPIVIVTADHGEALGDHGQPNHSTDLYNSQIRVPLVAAGPGIKPNHIMEKVSLTDLTPTLVELAGFEPPKGPGMDGRSIADLMTGKRLDAVDGGTAFAAMIKDRSNPGGVTAIVAGRWKLLDIGGVFELYDLHSDPHEQTNLITQRAEIATQMKKLLEQTREKHQLSPFD